jgi:hypothetical protein
VGVILLSQVHANQQHAPHRERATAVLTPMRVQVEWFAFPLWV